MRFYFLITGHMLKWQFLCISYLFQWYKSILYALDIRFGRCLWNCRMMMSTMKHHDGRWHCCLCPTVPPRQLSPVKGAFRSTLTSLIGRWLTHAPHTAAHLSDTWAAFHTTWISNISDLVWQKLKWNTTWKSEFLVVNLGKIYLRQLHEGAVNCHHTTMTAPMGIFLGIYCVVFPSLF